MAQGGNQFSHVSDASSFKTGAANVANTMQNGTHFTNPADASAFKTGANNIAASVQSGSQFGQIGDASAFKTGANNIATSVQGGNQFSQIGDASAFKTGATNAAGLVQSGNQLSNIGNTSAFKTGANDAAALAQGGDQFSHVGNTSSFKTGATNVANTMQSGTHFTNPADASTFKTGTVGATGMIQAGNQLSHIGDASALKTGVADATNVMQGGSQYVNAGDSAFKNGANNATALVQGGSQIGNIDNASAFKNDANIGINLAQAGNQYANSSNVSGIKTGIAGAAGVIQSGSQLANPSGTYTSNTGLGLQGQEGINLQQNVGVHTESNTSVQTGGHFANISDQKTKLQAGLSAGLSAGADASINSHAIAKRPQTGKIGTVPIDGNDPDIYTFKTSTMPFSYISNTDEDAFSDKLPPPTYLTNDMLRENKTFTKDEIFHGLEALPSGELKLVDPDILKSQKGLIKDALSSILKSVSEGRGVVGASLPIRIFEPRSLIERISDLWMCAPNYLIPATQTTDPVARMKNVVSMVIGALCLTAKQLKPFNPILGETYQAYFPESGVTIDLEHTSHHPPIAHYLITHKDFRLSGHYEFIAKLEGLTKNTVHMLQEGTSLLEFNDGHKITYTCPYLHLEGMMYGDRTAKFSGVLRVVDEKNKLKAIVKMEDPGEHKAFAKNRSDAFHGKIYRYKEPSAKSKKDEDLNFGDLETNICNLYGSWQEYLKIGDEETWNIKANKPTPFIPLENPLPSDARFREDLIWVRRGNKKYAQEWKLRLEVRQRAEKKLRIDGRKSLPLQIQEAYKLQEKNNKKKKH